MADNITDRLCKRVARLLERSAASRAERTLSSAEWAYEMGRRDACLDVIRELEFVLRSEADEQ